MHQIAQKILIKTKKKKRFPKHQKISDKQQQTPFIVGKSPNKNVKKHKSKQLFILFNRKKFFSFNKHIKTPLL
ncbi:hypothetical protein AUJ84_03685 [Candidatus Pacearchaeota archaeon CG1_02_32_132]|nr:MAG: hypothetical protein AUJ84_03685 [Candidatus Pacearchaeota archaeon CG1_02_32_132]